MFSRVESSPFQLRHRSKILNKALKRLPSKWLDSSIKATKERIAPTQKPFRLWLLEGQQSFPLQTNAIPSLIMRTEPKTEKQKSRLANRSIFNLPEKEELQLPSLHARPKVLKVPLQNLIALNPEQVKRRFRLKYHIEDQLK